MIIIGTRLVIEHARTLDGCGVRLYTNNQLYRFPCSKEDGDLIIQQFESSSVLKLPDEHAMEAWLIKTNKQKRRDRWHPTMGLAGKTCTLLEYVQDIVKDWASENTDIELAEQVNQPESRIKYHITFSIMDGYWIELHFHNDEPVAINETVIARFCWKDSRNCFYIDQNYEPRDLPAFLDRIARIARSEQIQSWIDISRPFVKTEKRK